ncbi:MAG: AMP-binding protein [Candidatus Baldrarchaeia archaeon]
MTEEVPGYKEYQLTIDKILQYGLFIAPEQKLVYAPANLPRKEFTYMDFADRVNRLGAVLEELGVKRADGPWKMGTRVAIMDWNSIRYQELLYSVPMYGAVANTINIRLAPLEILYTLTVTKPEVLFIHTDFSQYVDKILEQIKSIKHVVIMSDQITCTGKGEIPEIKVPSGVKVHEYEDLIKSVGKGEYNWPELDENVVATFFFTSGTTGLPKGVYHTHRQIVLATLQLLAAQAMEPINITSRDIVLVLVPYFHIVGWGTPYTSICGGVKMVFPGRYVWDHIAKLIPELVAEARKIDGKVVASGVPTMLYLILQELKKLGVTDLRGFQFGYGGSALPLSLYEEAKKMGIEIVTGYGPTETGMTAITRMIFIPRMWMKMGWDPEKMRDYFVTKNSLGVPVPLSFVKVVDEEGRELPQDGKTPGRLLFWSPSITREYYNDPEKTKRAWRFGYFDIDDVAIIDEYGSVLFVDRVKDVIKSGGEWVPSTRVEAFISTHPAVAEVAVIGVPHPKWVERPVAIVALKPGYSLTEEELKDYLTKNFVEKGEMPKWWIPDKIIFERELPKTATAKIDKLALKEKYKDLKLE